MARDGVTRRERRTAAVQRSTPSMRNIADRDVRVLETLVWFASDRGPRRGWATVRELGGAMHSHHAATLDKLARHELVERKWHETDRGRVIVSHITPKGRRVLAAVHRADAAHVALASR